MRRSGLRHSLTDPPCTVRRSWRARRERHLLREYRHGWLAIGDHVISNQYQYRNSYNHNIKYTLYIFSVKDCSKYRRRWCNNKTFAYLWRYFLAHWGLSILLVCVLRCSSCYRSQGCLGYQTCKQTQANVTLRSIGHCIVYPSEHTRYQWERNDMRANGRYGVRSTW